VFSFESQVTPSSRILSESERVEMVELADGGGVSGCTASHESLTSPCVVMRVCANEPG